MTDAPDNVFSFPKGRGVPEPDAQSFRPGAFLDENGKHMFAAVEGLDNTMLMEMLYRLRQHRALTDCLVDLMENEAERRDLRLQDASIER